eukprot:IDg9118t1
MWFSTVRVAFAVSCKVYVVWVSVPRDPGSGARYKRVTEQVTARTACACVLYTINCNIKGVHHLKNIAGSSEGQWILDIRTPSEGRYHSRTGFLQKQKPGTSSALGDFGTALGICYNSEYIQKRQPLARRTMQMVAERGRSDKEQARRIIVQIRKVPDSQQEQALRENIICVGNVEEAVLVVPQTGTQLGAYALGLEATAAGTGLHSGRLPRPSFQYKGSQFTEYSLGNAQMLTTA